MSMKIPELVREGSRTSLMVDGRPFLILGGEVRNSSASDLPFMDEHVWPRIRGLGLNTLIVPVSWELLEPEPGRFDFTLPDGLIAQAEREGVRLVLLWFGLWKNGISTYVPGWVKADCEQYFLMQDRYGKPLPAISPMCSKAVERDAMAFAALLSHLRETDLSRRVIMVQVENEMGLLGECRDFSPAAGKAYKESVPADMPGATGTWSEAFGDEGPALFMTYHYAKATELISRAGKKAYPLPMYVNAWLEQWPWFPGSYPTGGPIARHMDIWQAMAPSIDFLSPDIYLPDFTAVCREYTARGNPLFIPEARPCMDSASNVFEALGSFHALGFSPFAIENVTSDCPPMDAADLAGLNIMEEAFNTHRSGEFLSKSYSLLGSMLELIQEYRGTGRLAGFTCCGEPGELIKMSKINFCIQYPPRIPNTPKGGGLIIELDPGRYVVCGVNFRATVISAFDSDKEAELLSVTEGQFVNGRFVPGRRLNGDELGLRFGEEAALVVCEVGAR